MGFIVVNVLCSSQAGLIRKTAALAIQIIHEASIKCPKTWIKRFGIPNFMEDINYFGIELSFESVTCILQTRRLKWFDVVRSMLRCHTKWIPVRNICFLSLSLFNYAINIFEIEPDRFVLGRLKTRGSVGYTRCIIKMKKNFRIQNSLLKQSKCVKTKYDFYNFDSNLSFFRFGSSFFTKIQPNHFLSFSGSFQCITHCSHVFERRRCQIIVE